MEPICETEFINLKIINAAKKVYNSLKAGHNECIYHKALSYELQSLDFSIDNEMSVVVKYTDSKNHTHNLESERIDIFIHKYNIVVELKAIQRDITEQETCQIKKYFNELNKININVSRGIIINFPQASTKKIPEHIEYKIINNENYNSN